MQPRLKGESNFVSRLTDTRMDRQANFKPETKHKMANEEQIYIEEREDGKYAIRRGNSERASAVEDSQEKAIEVARRMFPGVKPHIERVRNVKTGGRDQWRDKR
jgi:hypothetical protein